MSATIRCEGIPQVSQIRQLSAQARELFEKGDLAGALENANKAVEQWRMLTRIDDTQFLPGLARSLDALDVYLAKAGVTDRALSAASESVRHWRRLAKAGPDRFGLELAQALKRLARHIARDFPRDFVALREEAATVLVQLAATNRKLMPIAAEDSARMAVIFARNGRTDKAVQHGEKAVELWRALVDSDIIQYGSQLAHALRQLSLDKTTAAGDADKRLKREARRVSARRILYVLRHSTRLVYLERSCKRLFL